MGQALPQAVVGIGVDQLGADGRIAHGAPGVIDLDQITRGVVLVRGGGRGRVVEPVGGHVGERRRYRPLFAEDVIAELLAGPVRIVFGHRLGGLPVVAGVGQEHVGGQVAQVVRLSDLAA